MQVGKAMPWLVKSGGKVLGPFQEKEIIAKLREREIVVLDEVSQPFSRWKYIRDEVAFASIVEELRRKNSRMNDDTTAEIDGHTSTASQTVSITDPRPGMDDLTEEIPDSAVQEAIFQSFDDVNKGGRDHRRNKGSDYTYESDPFAQKKAQEAARWLWVISGVLILLTVVYVMFTQFIAKPMKNRTLAETKISQGMEFLNDGRYALALGALEEAYEVSPNESSIWLHLGVLKIQVVSQNVEGRRILENLQEARSGNQKRLLSAMGLSYLRGGDYPEAQSFFQKSLNLSPSFMPARINLGASRLYTGEYKAAAEDFGLAIKDGSSDGSEVLMLVEAAAQLFASGGEDGVLENALAQLDLYLVSGTNYLAEALVSKMHILKLLNRKSEIYKVADQLLNVDPYLTANTKQDIYIHRDRINWSMYNQWCLGATSDLDPTSHIISAEAYCLFKSGELLEATRKIENAVAQTPKDPLVQSVFAYLLDEMRNYDRSKVAIDKALKFDDAKKYQLPRILQARFCDKIEDIICSINYWSELSYINPKSLAAIAGLARGYFLNKKYDQASKFLNRGLKISPNYIPFLQLQREMTNPTNAGRDL